MKLNPKQLAVSAALLGLLAAGAALPVAAASPISAPAAITFPWSPVAAESVETGDYAPTMTVGTAQQLSPVVQPQKAASRNGVSYVSDNPNIVSVGEDGVAQAVGLGTANITATCGDVSCTYTITTQPDSTMIATEMDITLASSTIAVGDTTSLSLAVLPTTAANYISVSLSSSDPGVATVNNFGKVTGVAPGKATITATAGDVTCSATVTVVAASSSSASTGPVESISLNTNYIVLKPGASGTITGSVAPSSASQKLTFTSKDKKIATVNGSGVVTGVATGATSIIVSNGKVSSSVTVIVNRTASASSSGTDSTGEGTAPAETDPIVASIENAASDTISYPQSQVPVLTAAMLNALRTTGRTLVLEAEDYTLTVDGSTIRNTTSEVNTALTFAPDEYGLRFTLNEGEAMPCGVTITMTGENAGYSRLYLHNAVNGKWQFLNSYKDGVAHADVAGEYLLTNQNLRFTSINWTFFIGAGILVVACLIAYVAVKKRYWFW